MVKQHYKLKDIKEESQKMNKKYQCSECNKWLSKEDFWTHKADNREWKNHRDKEYLYHKCKECCYKNIDWNNVNTLLDICQQFDVPYIEQDLQKYIDKYGYQRSSLGRYLNLMRLFSYYGFGFEDTQWVIEIRNQKKKEVKVEDVIE